ncbi:hypothetical protein L2U69_17940 [Zavarzinia compransoris]|uniref:DUF6414 family protein n=1 Tax=Zavarzinia marina TaxID=2911065 RepID=UPI001F2E45F0|nr:hypothetical protein [Zavarzinia marina]MCF4167533.1 hypothetical protein [Zavarzinia marina]
MFRFKLKFPCIGRKKFKSGRNIEETPEPLREFVYLDEVSLGSLLASQKGEITENITSQIENERIAEIGGKISASGPVLPSAEINSRFQTINSNALQTLRKATAQSLFRELHKLPNLRKIHPIEVDEVAESFENLFSGNFPKAIYNAGDLTRGDLVEFRVKLSASWIFQISSMVAEFSDMFDESPTLFMGHVKFTDLYQAKNANKIVNKLLAGLVPVDGVVSDYLVIRHGGEKFIVHKDITKKLKADFSPLRIVGVTEHLAYWKDIRRILFADNEFTMLCRLSKNGIQTDWNPIKVADVFKELAPNLAKQIEIAGRTAMLQSASSQSEKSIESATAKLTLALARYQDKLLGKINHCLTGEQLSELDREIASLPVNGFTAEGQRAAFAAARAMIESSTGLTIESSTDLELRESIRKRFEIPLLPESSPERRRAAEESDIGAQVEDANLLDVEVVAIYW